MPSTNDLFYISRSRIANTAVSQLYKSTLVAIGRTFQRNADGTLQSQERGYLENLARAGVQSLVDNGNVKWR